MRDRLTRCRACGETIMFAVVSNKTGKPPSRMPLDPRPNPAGNVASYHNGTGTRVGRVLGKDAVALGYEQVYMPHFATCAKKKAPEQTPTPPGVTRLDDFRRTRKAKKAVRRLRDRTT